MGNNANLWPAHQAGWYVSTDPNSINTKNVIGEHVDYSNFACLPMAISADVLLAVKPTTDGKITIANIYPDQFPTREFTVPEDGHIEIDATKTEWSNYFKAGLRGANEMIRKKGSSQPLTGMKVSFSNHIAALIVVAHGWSCSSCRWPE